MPENAVIPKAKVTFDVAKIEEAEAAMAAQMAARITAPSGDKIRINRDKTFQLPNGDTLPVLTGVVVDFVSMNEYYVGKFDPKNFTTPVCAAIGDIRKEMRPFDSSPKKQSDECVSCPMNQWGSDGNGKACKDQRVLAILPEALQADGPLMILKVSPTGTRFWDQHVASLRNMLSATPVRVITEISFAQDVDYASLRFRTVGANEQWATAFTRYPEARKRLLTEPELAPLESAKK